MPGFDGSGPLGRGPLSGRGRGFCAVKLPAKPGGEIVGCVGMAGYPVALPARAAQHALATLHHDLVRLEQRLDAFKERIRILQALQLK